MSLRDLKVALVHDGLIRRGGAEAVLEEMVRILPQSDVYALYSGNDPRMTVGGKTYRIHTSFLQKFPLWFRKHPGRLLPLLPLGAEQFDLSQYDLVISSASAFSKGVVTRSQVPHICYCHTPTRYLWDSSREAVLRQPRWKRKPLQLIQHFLRMADFAAAQRPTAYVANSEYTQARIWTYYRRESVVVYPPVDTSFYTPAPPAVASTFAKATADKKAMAGRRGVQGGALVPRGVQGGAPYFLCVGRLTPAKRFEQAVIVCEKLELPLVVVGAGYDRARLEKLAGVHTRFMGKVSRESLRELYRGARALIQPGIEDFGIAAAEALACGTPVVAYEMGGVTEIVDHGRHGLLYTAPNEEYLAEALRTFILRKNEFLPQDLQKRALKFSVNRFQQKFLNAIEGVLESGNDY